MLEPTQETPKASSRLDALAAAPAALVFERRELVETRGDRQGPSDERSVRSVERIGDDADECPDAEVRADELRSRPAHGRV
jgi:hypothetical protein